MCVIAVIETIRPTNEQIEQMFDANPRGGGAAWRALNDEGRQVVRWKKGLNKEEMIELNQTLPEPYVLHFRVPSGGTSASWLACHPFAVNEDASFEFEGETDGFVVFHNGFWTDWRTKVQAISLTGFVRIPSGPWSDSRALAWAAHHLGLGFLDIVDEKVVAFGPGRDDIEVFGGWQTLNRRDANGDEKTILVSNKTWERTVHTTHGAAWNNGRIVSPQQSVTELGHRAITTGAASTEQAGGAAQPATFPRRSVYGRTEHRYSNESTEDSARAGGGQSESVQEEDGTAASPSQQTHGQEKEETSLTLVGSKCSMCDKRTASGTTVDGDWFCWQCWSSAIPKEKPFVGLCRTCLKNHAGAKTIDDDKWICITCWGTNEKPKVYWPSQEVMQGGNGD